VIGELGPQTAVLDMTVSVNCTQDGVRAYVAELGRSRGCLLDGLGLDRIASGHGKVRSRRGG